jgi:hypothetical protein
MPLKTSVKMFGDRKVLEHRSPAVQEDQLLGKVQMTRAEQGHWTLY